MKESSSNTTREKLLDEAEKAFAKDGFLGASLREVMRNAGVNPATAHYHFGSKQAVYEAVIERRLKVINKQRVENLKLLNKSKLSGTKSVRAIIHAYIAPHFHVAKTIEGQDYSKIMSRSDVEPAELIKSIFDAHITPIREQYFEALRTCMPDIHVETMARLFSFVLSLMTVSPIDRSFSALTGCDPIPDNPDAFAWLIADFCAVGMKELAKQAAKEKLAGA